MTLINSALKCTILVWSIIFPFAFIHYIGNAWVVKKSSDKNNSYKKRSDKK